MKTVMHIILSLEIGGMEQMLANLVQDLDSSRFTSVVVCLQSLGAIGEHLRDNGVKVVLLPRMTPVVSYLLPLPLIKAIRKYRPDIIHVHSGCWHKAAMAGFLTGTTKIIYTEHGRHVPDIKKIMLLDKAASYITDHIVAVSENLALYMEQTVGIARKKISVIVNGIDAESFVLPSAGKNADRCRIAVIARLMPVKDIGTLLRAFQIVASARASVELQIIGDGSERCNLEELTCQLGITDKVEFLGFRRDIPHLLREIDIFALSSISEGTSITLLEAMAAGKPVVVTDVGGNPALVKDGENGFLVPAGEPARMAEKLLELVDDGALRQKMGATNQQKIRASFSVAAMAQAYQALYEGTA